MDINSEQYFLNTKDLKMNMFSEKNGHFTYGVNFVRSKRLKVVNQVSFKVNVKQLGNKLEIKFYLFIYFFLNIQSYSKTSLRRWSTRRSPMLQQANNLDLLR
ncbi:hypothetical protein BpHYR1_012824, partial [Brachionus plicatilis]